MTSVFRYSGDQNGASVTAFAQFVANKNAGSLNDIVLFADFEDITHEIEAQNVVALSNGFGTDDTLKLNLWTALNPSEEALSNQVASKYNLDANTADQLVRATKIFDISVEDAIANYHQNKEGQGWYQHFNNNDNMTSPSGLFQPMP